MNDLAEATDQQANSTAERLAEAREFIGLPVSVAADALRLEDREVADLESGKREPTDQQLDKCSILYRRPIWWLTGGPRRPVEFDQRESDMLARLTDHDREAVIGFAEFLADAGPPSIPQR